MGLSVYLKQENGTVVAALDDVRNVLHRALPEAGDTRFPYLSCVDRYGDTVFNGLQAARLMAELKSLPLDPSDAEAREIVKAILALAARLQAETHTCLVFEGD